MLRQKSQQNKAKGLRTMADKFNNKGENMNKFINISILFILISTIGMAYVALEKLSTLPPVGEIHVQTN
jgi:Na+/citrate or Na+/malate symporter